MNRFYPNDAFDRYPEHPQMDWPDDGGPEPAMDEAELANTIAGIVSDLCWEKLCSHVQFVQLALRFRQKTGMRLKDAVAQALGCPSETPSLALNFVRTRVPGLSFMERDGKLFVGRQESPSSSVVPSPVPPPQSPPPATAPRAFAEGPAGNENDIERFAYVEYESLLPAIAEYAEPETWGENHWILKARLRALFAWSHKRWSEASVEERGRYLYVGRDRAVMPLGLYDRGGAEMFLTFQPNRRLSPMWYLNGSSVAAPLMRLAVQGNVRLRAIGEPPQWPTFPIPPKPTVRDLRLDPDLLLFRIIAQLRAIEDDALLRTLCQADAATLMPVCNVALEARARRRTARTALQEKNAFFAETQAFQSLSAAFRHSIVAHEALAMRITQALEQLHRRLNSCPDLPVPAYDQLLDAASGENYIDFLLPLTLDGGRSSVAIAFCQKGHSVAYVPKVCLSLNQAYVMARVIGRPESSWLQPAGASLP